MPLLDVVQRVCDEIGLPRPSAVATSSEQLARQMFGLANTELEELCKRDWPVLQREYAFNTVIGQEAYTLPTDFRKLLGQTLFSTTRYYELRASVQPHEWQRTKAFNLGTISCARGRIYGSPRKLHIIPVPSSIEGLVFEYATNKFVTRADSSLAGSYISDTDTAVIDEGLVRMGLKWRIKHAKGLDFGTDLAEYTAAVARDFAAELASPTYPIGGPRCNEELAPGYVRENGFG